MGTQPVSEDHGEQPALQRRLNLPLLVLYGLGVTIGAGIYVLVGETAGKAGYYAPISFVCAAIVVAFTGFSYAELATRYPVSAGEAAYVKDGFRSSRLSALIGILVVASGVVSSAAVSLGAAAYLQTLIPLPHWLLLGAIILSVGLISIWGILESVSVASLVTLVEIGGLIMVIYFGVSLEPDSIKDVGKLIPPFEAAAWSGILSAGLLAFFAFVGFEDIANVAEEVKNPYKTMPRGIFLTLIVATILYVLVVSVAVLVVPLADLAGSKAPLALIFASGPVWVAKFFGSVAFFATLNGVLIQTIMASRVIYGMGKQETLPEWFAAVHPVTRTPIHATLVVVGIILFLAYFLPIGRLAETTSLIVLTVFFFVNIALILLKIRQTEPVAETVYTVPMLVPVLGTLTCVGLISARFLAG
ncbi:APC family permease [Sneathiella chinensis]|uniref:Amino acid transporter n=1 Tax=Sneathiella chinensis TaxID=349750 RepID=A0ABQ5U9Q6_9PROT|nr:APC family permease [Sneathiella chinensis]GLQ07241.1 amino acid transporter [Sneathiella chinensis]